MKRLLPAAAAAMILALAACQAEAPPAQAAAPVDPVVATAVSDVRSAAIDPVTGKHRDAGAVFTAQAGQPAAPVGPSVTLGATEPGALSPVLGTVGSGEPTH